MSLKMKLTASISAFFLVVGLMLIGIMAVNQATVNMGGSISFTATDVYARVTGKIENAQGEYANKELPTLEFSAENDTPDQSGWSNLNLLFDDDATPIVIKVTVENLSAQNTLRVNLNDTLSSTVENLEKVVKNDGEDYTNQTDITLQPNGQENDSTTFTITMSVTNKNNSVTADFDYELNLEDQYYVPQSYEYFTFVVNSDGTTVTLRDYDSSLSDTTDIVIPESVSQNESGQWIEGNTYTVTDIFSATLYRNGVFYNSGITSIELPSTLETIGNYAFFGCSVLTGELIIPDSLTSIGEYAFSYCSGLTGELDFSKCTNLTSIGEQAFSGCSELTGELDFSKCTNLTSIGEYAFSYCSGLTGELIIPDSLTSIGNSAFNGCSGLETLEVEEGNSVYHNEDNCIIQTATNTVVIGCKNSIIPNYITSIGNGAFYGCSGLTSITLPLSLTSIGNSAFWACSGLTEVDLSVCTNLSSIGRYAFFGCSVLTEVDLSKCTSLISTGDQVFSDSGLESITLPSSLTKIGFSEFSGCTGLTTIRIEATTPPRLGSIEIPSNATIEVPSASVEAYKSASGWSKYASQIVGY